jgi:hypothetical protein
VCAIIALIWVRGQVSQQSLPTEQFEIIVILEGIVESTGMTVQARTSYLPKEILWGYRCVRSITFTLPYEYRFEKLVTYTKENDDGIYRVDYSIFNSTYAVTTPSCSSKAMDERKVCLVCWRVTVTYAYSNKTNHVNEVHTIAKMRPRPSSRIAARSNAVLFRRPCRPRIVAVPDRHGPGGLTRRVSHLLNAACLQSSSCPLTIHTRHAHTAAVVDAYDWRW